MAKQYLRVSTDWTKLADPSSTALFFLNTSRSPVEIVLTKRNFSPTSVDRSFVIGGSISQLRAESDDYVFAKAVSETIVVSDTSRISFTDSVDIKSQLDELIVQVMKLSNRVTDNEIFRVETVIDFELMRRELLDIDERRNNYELTLTNGLLRQHLRLFAVENVLYKLQLEEFAAKQEIESGADSEIASMQQQISVMSGSIDLINNKLNELIPKVDEAWGDYEELLQTYVEPIAQEVGVIEKDLATLNNSLVRMSVKYTSAQIEQAYAMLAADLDAEHLKPVTAVKDIVIELNAASETNEAQDVEIEQKVDNSDFLMIDTNLTDLSDILETP